MYHIRDNAEQSVRNLLKEMAEKMGTDVLSARDYLDDGSPVRFSSLVYSSLHPPPPTPHLHLKNKTDPSNNQNKPRDRLGVRLIRRHGARSPREPQHAEIRRSLGCHLLSESNDRGRYTAEFGVFGSC